MIGQLIPVAFQFQFIFMSLAIYIKDGCGPSYRMRRQLQLRKTKDNSFTVLA